MRECKFCIDLVYTCSHKLCYSTRSGRLNITMDGCFACHSPSSHNGLFFRTGTASSLACPRKWLSRGTAKNSLWPGEEDTKQGTTDWFNGCPVFQLM